MVRAFAHGAIKENTSIFRMVSRTAANIACVDDLSISNELLS